MTHFTLLVFGLAMSAVCAGTETGYYALNPLKLRVVAAHSKLAELLVKLTRSPHGFLTMLLVGNNLANYLVMSAGVSLLAALAWPQPEFLATLLLTPLTFVLGEVGPKQRVLQQPLTSLLRLTPVLAGMRVLLAPVVWPLSVGSRALSHDPSEGLAGRRHLAALLMEGTGERGGQAPIMQAALRALESEGKGLRLWMRRDLPVLPPQTSLALARAELARSKDTVAVLERKGRAPAILFGTRLVHQAASVPVESLAVEVPTLGVDLDLSDALAKLRDQGVSFALVGEAGAWEGVFDLEYALSLLLRPDGRTPDV